MDRLPLLPSDHDSVLAFIGRLLPIRPAMLLLVAAMTLVGCRYPTDAEHSLERIRGGVMKVGLTENPPWVIRNADGPAGVEVEIIGRLAEQLDADVQWYWDNESALLQALKAHQLDLVAGGLTKSSRLSKFAAPTKPYFQSRYTVGVPEAGELPASLSGQKVALHPVNHYNEALTDEGAQPVLQPNLANVGGAVAAPTWWLLAHGFEPGTWELTTDKHVLALPMGENAWMLSVQRHLNEYPDIAQRLRQLEATP